MRLLTLLLCMLILPDAASANAGNVSITHFNERNGYEQTQVSCALQDRQGYIWLSTWNGLSRYDGYLFRNFKARPGDSCPLKSNRITYIKELDAHNIECVAHDGSFYRFNKHTEKFEAVAGLSGRKRNLFLPTKQQEDLVKSIPAFSNIWIRILLVDKQGGIWVDTHKGLYRIYFTKPPLSPDKMGTEGEVMVRGLFEDSRQQIWIGDKNGYLRIMDASRGKTMYITAQGNVSSVPTAFGYNIYRIFEDHRGDIWLGAKPGGLFRLHPRAGSGYGVTRYRHVPGDSNSLNNDNVYDITEDKYRRLWIATYEGGLNMLDLNSERPVFVHKGNLLKGHPKDGESNKVQCLLIADGNILLIGTQGGLYTSSLDGHPARMRFYRNQRRPADAASISSNRVMGLLFSRNENIVVATHGGGLCFVEPGDLLSSNIRFRPYTTDKGLASDVCLGITEDREGILYVVSAAAISRINPADSICTRYLEGTFVPGFTFSEAPPVYTAGGKLFFGTSQGLLGFVPTDIRKSHYIPPIVFDCPEHIELTADEKSLNIQLSALDYNKNEQIIYAYRLERVDSQWLYTTDPRINLANVPPGTHRLHVKSTNGDGIWVSNERVLTIYRPTRFNETPYAWMLYGLLITVFFIGAYRLITYIRRLQHEIRNIQLTSNERIAVLSERVKELLSIRENLEKINKETEHIGNEEDRQFASRIAGFMEQNLSNSELTVQDFAREVGCSRTLLFARMKSIFGVSPNNYIINMRIERSKELLARPGSYIAETAYRCGFSDPKYFSRCFKKLTGQTPSEYQESKCNQE